MNLNILNIWTDLELQQIVEIRLSKMDPHIISVYFDTYGQ